MKCPHCGGENREGARFCRHCGQEMELTPSGEAAPMEPAAEEEGAAGAEEAAPEPEPLPVVEAEASDEEQAAIAELEPEAEPAAEPGADEIGAELAEPPVETEAEPEARDAEPEAAVEPGPPPPAEEEEAAGPGLEAEGAADLEAEEEEEDVLAFWRKEAEPLAEAPPGTLIADRYLLIEALDVQEEAILYAARDLRRCWQCGFEGNKPGDEFCAQCGASLDRKPEVRLLETADVAAEPVMEETVVERLVHEGRAFLVLAGAEPQAEPPAEPSPATIRLVVGQRSDAGQVRSLNEDSLLVLSLAPTYESRTAPVLGLYAVADGMGGHEGGEVASKLALQVLAREVLASIALPEIGGRHAPEEEIAARLQGAALAANDAVYLARQKRGNDMGTTLTAVLIRDDQLFVAHVGDSRAYRWNANGLEQLTTDHSVVASMVASGQAAPEEIYTHPHRSVIYRCIGDQPVVEVESNILPLAPGDRLLVCSDGLWEMIRDEGIEDVLMQESEPQAACDLLVKHANVAGGEDNISVILIQVETR